MKSAFYYKIPKSATRNIVSRLLVHQLLVTDFINQQAQLGFELTNGFTSVAPHEEDFIQDKLTVLTTFQLIFNPFGIRENWKVWNCT